MVDAYTKNGSVLRFTRRGKKSNNGRYVVVDDLSMTYDGNKLVKVEDSAQLVTTTGSFDFTDGCDDDEEYLYDGCGALVADKNKGISNIMYDNLGYPKEIQFSNGNKTRYVYLPDGTKLKTTHITAVDGIVVPLSNTVELADYQIINRDSTEYFGDIIYENGIVRRYIYDGGYVSVAYYSPSDVSYLSYHHYVKDHIGNIRAVVSDNGHVEQTTHYYPSGAIMSDISTNQSLQPNKYNGKELDRMHGLDWYDYGARNYDAQILTWDRMDPLCEKYYNISPYVYCMNNPVRFVDPDGRRIKGQTRNDAEQVVEDLRAIFSAEEFNNFRNLIVQSGKKQRGKTLAKISDDAFKAAFDNVKLSKDQQVLANMVFNTINSDDVHTIEYAETGGIVSEDAKNAFNPVPAFNSTIETYGGLPTFLIENAGGGGLTMKTSNGTHTVVVNSSSLHPVGRAVTTGHELFGHGRSLALGRFNSQHVDAIQTENLIRRVMGITSINDGSNHANREYISNPTSLPEHR